MTRLLLIPLCITLGYLLQTSRWTPPHLVFWLNRFIVFGPLPALAFYNIQTMQLEYSALYPVATGWILFLGAAALFTILTLKNHWSRQTAGALILTGGLGNTSFIGYPVLLSLFGAEGLKIGVLVDQTGSFLILSSLGLITATLCSERHQGTSLGRQLMKRLLSFPTLFAVILALSLRNSTLPEFFMNALKSFGSLLAPLGLLSIGLQWKPKSLLALRKESEHWSPLLWCLSYKLILGPAFIAILYRMISSQSGLPLEPLTFKVSVLEAAMAPMITGGIVAVEYGLQPELVSLVIGAGIPLSILTLGLWTLLLN